MASPSSAIRRTQQPPPPPSRRARPGPWPSPSPSPSNPPPLSWARRTGFRNVPSSGEHTPLSNSSGAVSRPIGNSSEAPLQPNSCAGSNSVATATAAAAVAERAPPDDVEAQAQAPIPVPVPVPLPPHMNLPSQSSRVQPNSAGIARNDAPPTAPELIKQDDGPLHVKYALRDNPGLVPIVAYGIQHYLSMLGSLVLVPLVIVPAMGGSPDDTAKVVSTAMFISGITTLLHTFLGSRLPLVQGPSFVYFAPVLALINSPEFHGTDRNFKHIMKELQGAVIVGSAFQALIGYSGLMSLLLRFINPVVVSSTIAAIGLSFFSYGFTKVGACLEIGICSMLLLIIFSLYLRKIKLFGHYTFLIYAVPVGLGIAWAVSFLLTETGVYSYRNCDANIHPSNNTSAYCRKHVLRMKACRADSSLALGSSPWFRFPYPLQWGTPIFSWKMVLVMCIVSIIASVDSVGTYYATSVFVSSRPPTLGVVSRAIGMEGLSSFLAALWGTGTGSTTLTENVHTIVVTRMGSRRGVEFGSVVLILLSLIGKVGGFIASIPDVIVAGQLCFMWAMLVALGLSNLRLCSIGSYRNNIIIGLALFLSLSIPSFFQQYGATSNASPSVPSYFVPYVVSSHGPFQTADSGVNYVLNIVLSLYMVIAFLIAVILDNTVPGSRQERGVYTWTSPDVAAREPSVLKDYALPFRVGRAFRWVKWVGI